MSELTLEQSIMQALADNPGVHADEITVQALGGGAVFAVDGREDADTEAAILQALIRDDEIRSLGVDVESRSGIVTLGGEVETEAQRDRAERIALAVPGVRGVHNELEVRSLTA